MTKYVVLFRGLNTGGLIIKMEDLREQVIRMGYENPKTVLATGNLLITSEESATQIKNTISSELSKYMNMDIHCIVRTEEDIIHLIEEVQDEKAGYHYYILFCETMLYHELSDSYSDYEKDENESFFLKGQDIHWIVKKGNTLQGFGKYVLGKKKYKDQLTSRNLNTVKKIMLEFQKM